jgi:hypothetical protein
MDWRDLEKHFSAARLGRYRASCNGDEARAAKAYVSNMLVAEAMMPMLNVLEIALKNGIHQRLATLYQRNDWWAQFQSILWKELRLVFPRCPKPQRQRQTVSSALNQIRECGTACSTTSNYFG